MERKSTGGIPSSRTVGTYSVAEGGSNEQLIYEKINRFLKMRHFKKGSSVTSDEINSVFENLGMDIDKFNIASLENYKEFLREYGAICGEGFEICGPTDEINDTGEKVKYIVSMQREFEAHCRAEGKGVDVKSCWLIAKHRDEQYYISLKDRSVGRVYVLKADNFPELFADNFLAFLDKFFEKYEMPEIGIMEIREKTVECLIGKMRDKFSIVVPEAYKSFLLEENKDNINKEDLDMFQILSFLSPKENIEDEHFKSMVDSILNRQLSARTSILSMEKFKESKNKQKFWCIGSQYINEKYMYYCVDLLDDDEKLPVYRVGNDGTRYPILKDIKEFTQYCKDQCNVMKAYNKEFLLSTSKKYKVLLDQPKNIREILLDKFEERIKDVFNKEGFPQTYKSFLINQDKSVLNEEELGPFEIFSFSTPETSELENVALENLYKQYNVTVDMLTRPEFREEDGQKFWCIGYQDMDGECIYYCINLLDHNDRLPVYKVDTDGTRHLIFKGIEEFVQYCKDQFSDIKKYYENRKVI
ncbi:MAG: SMI1/KNR4 family protein [Candidatus Cardinium sp.]|nr:SMI1/KNR4 family protein [Candidatus Cardinium sp.]